MVFLAAPGAERTEPPDPGPGAGPPIAAPGTSAVAQHSGEVEPAGRLVVEVPRLRERVRELVPPGRLLEDRLRLVLDPAGTSSDPFAEEPNPEAGRATPLLESAIGDRDRSEFRPGSAGAHDLLLRLAVRPPGGGGTPWELHLLLADGLLLEPGARHLRVEVEDETLEFLPRLLAAMDGSPSGKAR